MVDDSIILPEMFEEIVGGDKGVEGCGVAEGVDVLVVDAVEDHGF